MDLFQQSSRQTDDEEGEEEEAARDDSEDDLEEEVEEEDANGFRLETDHYVREIKERRGQLFAQIDSTPAEKLRRKVGYEIERRLVE